MLISNTVLALYLAVAADPLALTPEQRSRVEAEYAKLLDRALTQEGEFTEQRIKARTELTEKDDAVRNAEITARQKTEHTALRIKQLEAIQENVTEPKAREARDELRQLRRGEQLLQESLRSLRHERVVAEERLRLLERVQELKRLNVTMQLKAAAARLWPMPTQGVPDDRLRELETKLDAVLTELRRHSKEPKKP